MAHFVLEQRGVRHVFVTAHVKRHLRPRKSDTMKLTLVLTILLLSTIGSVYGQPLQKTDYTISEISLGSRADSVYRHLGQPKTIDKTYNHYTDPDSDLVFEYDSITVSLDHSGSVKSFGIIGDPYRTARGISVGTRPSDVLKRYGEPRDSDSSYAIYDESNIARGIIFYFDGGLTKRIYLGWFSD